MANNITDDNIGGLNLNSQNVRQIVIPSEERYKEILNDMVMAFLGQRTGCETPRQTEDYCRGVLKTCLTGFHHKTGKVWKSAPGKNVEDWFESLKMRLRVFKYDIVTKTMIKGNEKTISKKIKELSGTGKDLSTALPGNLNRTFTVLEDEEFKRFIDKFRQDFESNVTIVDELMIRRLAFLSVLSERDITHVDLSKDLTKEIKELAESLGVAGKQRISVLNTDKTGTLDLLSTKYKKTLEEHVEIETMWKLEELKMVSNAVHRGTTPEFLAMSWVKQLYGKTIDGKELSLNNLDKFLKKNGIDV
jgi:hypothetical protein